MLGISKPVADPSVEQAWREAEDHVTTTCRFCMFTIKVPLLVFNHQRTASCFDAGYTGCYNRFKEGLWRHDP